MRKCPKCGKKFKGPENRCYMSYGSPPIKCDTVTVEILEWTEEDEAEAAKDLEEGLAEDPLEDDEIENEDEDLREDLKGQSDQIHDLLEKFGPLTYKELAEKLDVSPKRASNIVGTMIRDGVELKREGSPRKVSLV